ncbi:SWIM zinc finger family protein [Longimicrobium sp.]|uniref:SWIM zinc finger family protein n=1 Tax=Longimicrobium sp. TaxID=2029185 RepID=UPI003B3B7CCD
MSSETLPAVLTADLLFRLAGDTTYLRGLAYANEDRVEDLVIQDGVLVAHVRGTETYTVRLDTEKPGLSFDCTCPVGDEVRFCKHCVAVGLTWLLAQGETLVITTPSARPAEPSMDRVRAFLERQDADSLRAILLAEVDVNENLRERLLLRDAAGGSDEGSLKRLRAAIDRATTIPDFVDYAEATAYAAVLDEMVDGIASVAGANPAAAIELLEHAIWQVEDAMQSVDDSDGRVGDVLRRLQEIHLDVCTEARPDPTALAQRLFEGEMRSDFDSFYGAAETYAELLGDAGLAEYRRLATARWDQLPALRPGERDADPGMDRWRITHMMEGLAKATCDVEELVAIRSRDLSQPHAFLQIAEIYREAGKYDRAMEWARRGLQAFPAHQDSRLLTFLADEHHRRGEHEQAMELAWQLFAARPFLADYQLLKQHADRFGAWKSWRERALARMRERARKRTAGMIHLPGRAPDERSELVSVFLWEGDGEAAWREAQEGGCSANLWLRLARIREAEHPDEALAVYRKQIDHILIATGDRAYSEAVKLLPRIRETMNRVGEDFATYLTGLRTTHKRRRKLMEMIDRFEHQLAHR